MAQETPTPGIAKVLKAYFGYRPGEGLNAFADEIRKLTAEDKKQIVEGIVNETFTY